jgi:putative FmdB family regulatory protein
MPTYEYACTKCGNRFEIFRRIDDDPVTVCEACGGTLRKVFHPAGIVFKGSGFYATDSRSKKASPTAAGSSDGKAGDGRKTEPASTANGSTKDSPKEKTA